MKSIKSINPKVIVVEYNPIFGPSKNIVVNEKKDKEIWWSNEFMFGASLKAYEFLLNNYSLVACSSSGANAFFVSNEKNLLNFEQPFTSENYYESEKYYLIKSYKSWHNKRLFKKIQSIKKNK